MVEKEDLIRLQERIKTTQTRFENIIRFRNVKIFGEKKKIHKKIVQYLVKSIKKDLDPAEVQKIVAYLREEAAVLLERTERERYSLDVLLKVINHPRHLPVVFKIFHQLEEDEKRQFEHPIRAVWHIFKQMEKEIYNNLIPNVNRQLGYLNNFVSSGNLTPLIEYSQLFKENLRFLEEFNKKTIKPTAKYISRVWKRVKKVVKKPFEFTEEHKTAVAVFALSITLLAVVIPAIAPAGGILGGIFSFFKVGVHYGEKILHTYHVGHASETLIKSIAS